MDLHTPGRRRRPGTIVVDATYGGVAVRMYRNEFGCSRADIGPIGAISGRTSWHTHLAWDDRGYEYANGTDAVAQIYGRLAAQLAEIHSTLRALAKRGEFKLSAANEGNNTITDRPPRQARTRKNVL